jgi:hypothetical protein
MVITAGEQPSIANEFPEGKVLLEVTLLTAAMSDTKLPACKNTPESYT